MVSDKVQHIAEEMLCGIMPFEGAVTMLMEYSEKSGKLNMAFRDEGCAGRILDRVGDDSLSLMMVRGMSSSLTESDGAISIEV